MYSENLVTSLGKGKLITQRSDYTERIKLLKTSRKRLVSIHFTVLRESLVALSIGVTHSLILKDTREVNSMLFTE